MSSGGHASANAKAAVRAIADTLSDGEVRFGHMGAGDQGLIMMLKGSANFAVVFYFTYSSSLTNKAAIQSMSKYNGSWGDWVTISP